MNIRFLPLALLLFAGNSAQAQVSYIQNIALPADRVDEIIPESNAPIDTTSPYYNPSGSDSFYIYTPKENYIFDPSTSSFQFNNSVPNGPDMNFGGASQVVVYHRLTDDPGVGVEGNTGPAFLINGGSVLDTYRSDDEVEDYVQSTPTVTVADSMAYGQNVTLISTPTQVLFAPNNNTDGSTHTEPSGDGSLGQTTFNSLIPQNFNSTPTGTLSGSLSNVTGLSFAPGPQGLLYVLDWGNQQVDGFSVSSGIATFKLGFKIPTSLLASNTTGKLGFTVDDFGHILIADGKGGGIEMDLQGNILAIFDPPTDDVTGINVFAGDGFKPGDSSFITGNSLGDIFVENGADGLHEYQDLSAVPEPSAWALILFGGAALAFSTVQSRKATSPRLL